MLLHNKKYWLILIPTIIIVFVFNINHLNQQVIFNEIFSKIADNLLSGRGYSCPYLNKIGTLYPIWGYTLIVAFFNIIGSVNILIIIFQVILCLAAIYYFYKLLNIKPRYFHIPLLIPFIALMSVKWPDAIVGFLLVLYVYEHYNYLKLKKFKSLLFSGIALGLIVNFRSEYLYLPLFILLSSLLPFSENYRKRLIGSSMIILLITIIFLLPWAYRSWTISGEPRLTASNGGAVMYISLGQLPNNPWHIEPYDKSAYNFAEQKGEKNPYTPRSDKLFKEEVFKQVKKYPASYLKKCVHNFVNTFTKGVYTGEYANFFIDTTRRNKIDSEINKQFGAIAKIKYIFALPFRESIPLLTEKLIQGIFIPIVFVLTIFFFLVLTFHKKLENKILLGLITGIILYKFLTISLIQYEYRHVNSFYIFLHGVFLYYLPQVKGIWSKKTKKI